jgi:hypothetical protein
MASGDALLRSALALGQTSRAFQLLLELESNQLVSRSQCITPHTYMLVAEAAVSAEDFQLANAVLSKAVFGRPKSKQVSQLPQAFHSALPITSESRSFLSDICFAVDFVRSIQQVPAKESVLQRVRFAQLQRLCRHWTLLVGLRPLKPWKI